MADPRQAARQWIDLVFPEMSAVIDLDQQTSDAPRPALPYAGIMLESSRPSGWQTPVEDTPETDPPRPKPEKYDRIAGWTREGQLLIVLYGPGSQIRAEELQLSISSPDVIELLDGLDVSVQRPELADNTSAILDTSREPRASLTMTVLWYAERTTEIDVIEEATIDLTVTEQA